MSDEAALQKAASYYLIIRSGGSFAYNNTFRKPKTRVNFVSFFKTKREIYIHCTLYLQLYRLDGMKSFSFISSQKKAWYLFAVSEKNALVRLGTMQM
jgi:hypothetical protein